MRLNSLALTVFFCGAMSVAIAFYAWRRRTVCGARLFSIFMFSQALYVLGYAFELASLDLPAMLFWSKVQYAGITTFPTLYLLFVIQFSGRARWLTRKKVALLFVIPALLLLAKLTDEIFHLIYSTVQVETGGLIPLLDFSRGPLYLPLVIYNLIAVTAGTYLLWRKQRYGSALYRRQSNLMLFAAVILYLVYILYISGFVMFPSLKQLDLNPFIYTLWGVAISWAMFRYRLFDLAPIAREALIENIADGVVVLDEYQRVVDANPAALRIFNWSKIPLGEPAESLWVTWPGLLALCLGNHAEKSEIYHQAGDDVYFYDASSSVLTDPHGHTQGHMVVVHNITELKRAEQQLRELSLEDDLTGINNRRGFKVLAPQMLTMVDRMKLNALLVYIDLDGLKGINDTLGHAAGDQALIDTAEILKGSFRASDLIARQGGDEFTILMLETSDGSAETILARLQSNIDTHNQQAGCPFRLSLSYGAARYNPETPLSLDDLTAQADRAMYVQKLAKKISS